MRRATLLLVMATLFPADVIAQLDTVPAPNRRLRVTLPHARLDGRIVRYTTDTIILDTARAITDTVVVRIPRLAVSVAHLHTGVSLRPRIASSAMAGGLVAFLVAGVVQEDNEYAWGRRAWQRFLVASAFVVGGGVLGGAVGAWLAPDRWVKVDVRPYPTGR
ncbi:MAG TPA: hypothetical protein VEB19_12255 [Gemmatimonadaceae bacterium]|nr:hypothetical protein [Gemmatimonadaceae bacterium]